MKQYAQNQLQSQVQVNNITDEIDPQKANYFLNDTHFKAQSAEVSQGNQLYYNLQQNKLLNQNVLENPNTFDENNSNLFQKQFKSNNENALQYLNISSQNNKSLIESINSMNKINRLLGENLIKRIHNENELLKQNYKLSYNPNQMRGKYTQKDFPYQNENPILVVDDFNGQNKNIKGLRKNIINSTFDEIQNKANEDIQNIQTISSNNNQHDDLLSGTTLGDSKRQSCQSTSQRVFNTKDDFNEFLKEENSNLKYTNFVYKQLLDSLFFFINSLSHKYSFNKEIYTLSYYIEHLDELTKNLLELDKWISNISEINKGNSFKSVQIVNENEITLGLKKEIPVTPSNNLYLITRKTEDDEKLKQRLNSEVNHGNNYTNNRSVSSLTSQIKRIPRSKISERKDCIACLLGAGASKRGYSPMMFNPYKKYSNCNTRGRDNSLNKFNTTIG